MVMASTVKRGVHSTLLLMAPAVTNSIALAAGHMPFNPQEWHEWVGNMLGVDSCGTKGW